MNFDFIAGEVLLVNKPLKWTSFDVVNKLRYAISSGLPRNEKGKMRKIKVGHAGTLDPLADGLLIICTGKKTKVISGFQGLDKEYTGTITIGATRPSYDKETEIDATYDIGEITEEAILHTATQFIGETAQLPPVFSAIKVNGKRAYEKSRKGEKVELKPRNIRIEAFDITRIQLPEIDFRIRCSKGTYIRSIAYDFGRMLNNGAYLSSLCRTEIGEHKLSDAWEVAPLIDEIKRCLSLPDTVS